MTHIRQISHSYVWHDSLHVSRASFIYMTWLLPVHHMLHSCIWHDSFLCVTCCIHICDMTPSCVSHASFISMTCPHPMCHMLHSNVWHDSTIYKTYSILMYIVESCLHSYCGVMSPYGDMTPQSYIIYKTYSILMCHTTHSNVTWLTGHSYDNTNAYTVTWLIDMCDMTHAHICTTTHWPEWHDSCIHVWHDSLTCAPWLIHTPERRKFPPPPHCPFYWRYYACRWPSSTCACLKEYQMTHPTYWEDSFAVLRV